jgi:hypothetical protein
VIEGEERGLTGARRREVMRHLVEIKLTDCRREIGERRERSHSSGEISKSI